MRIVLALICSSAGAEAFSVGSGSRLPASRRAAVATSFEEDLALTIQVILDHQQRSTTVGKEQFLQQMKEMKSSEANPIDVSIPYDAAALLAYEEAGSSGDYAAFKAQYEADTVAMVTAKKITREGKTEVPAKSTAPDLSIPYDAAAKLAYEASDKSVPYEHFKGEYEAKAVELVKSKNIDLSVPYDAPARLAFEKSDRKTPFADFKTKYEADAVAAVIAKKTSA